MRSPVWFLAKIGIRNLNICLWHHLPSLECGQPDCWHKYYRVCEYVMCDDRWHMNLMLQRLNPLCEVSDYNAILSEIIGRAIRVLTSSDLYKCHSLIRLFSAIENESPRQNQVYCRIFLDFLYVNECTCVTYYTFRSDNDLHHQMPDIVVQSNCYQEHLKRFVSDDASLYLKNMLMYVPCKIHNVLSFKICKSIIKC